jgi:hypothetical protein
MELAEGDERAAPGTSPSRRSPLAAPAMPGLPPTPPLSGSPTDRFAGGRGEISLPPQPLSSPGSGGAREGAGSPALGRTGRGASGDGAEAAMRAAHEMSELLAATRTQVVLLLQADSGRMKPSNDQEMVRMMQVQLEETRRLLAQEQVAKKQLQMDLSQAQREIEAKDKQLVTLLRRSGSSGGPEMEKKLREQLAEEQKTSAELTKELQKQIEATSELRAQLDLSNGREVFNA